MTTVTGARFGRYREEYLPAILEVVERSVVDAGLVGSSIAEMLDYQMETGGKRLRAVLPLMVADVLGVEPGDVVPFGAACELIHNATLVHDDLQDGDKLRRGEPTIWSRYGAERAINLGDAILYLAPRCLDYLDVEADRRWEVASRMYRYVLGVIDGQEREFALEFSSASREDYDRMVVGKTSGLFALPIVGAAQLCGADAGMLEALEEASHHLGVLFQIQDDIVDVYGEKGRENPGGDLREGKISALVVAFRDRAPEAEVEKLGEILRRDREATSLEDVAWARERFRIRGALDDALEAIEDRRRRALDIESLTEHKAFRDLIGGLIDVFLGPIDNIIR